MSGHTLYVAVEHPDGAAIINTFGLRAYSVIVGYKDRPAIEAITIWQQPKGEVLGHVRHPLPIMAQVRRLEQHAVERRTR